VKNKLGLSSAKVPANASLLVWVFLQLLNILCVFNLESLSEEGVNSVRV